MKYCNILMPGISNSSVITTKTVRHCGLLVRALETSYHQRYLVLNKTGWVINKRDGNSDSREWCVLSGGLKGKENSFPVVREMLRKTGKVHWWKLRRWKSEILQKSCLTLFCGLADLSNSGFSCLPVNLTRRNTPLPVVHRIGEGENVWKKVKDVWSLPQKENDK